jgi:hypothetical protein
MYQSHTRMVVLPPVEAEVLVQAANELAAARVAPATPAFRSERRLRADGGVMLSPL